MKLQQGQTWQKGEDYYRIVRWERLAIEYKLMQDLETKEGDLHQVTKKEFCRLIKGASLIDPQTIDPETIALVDPDPDSDSDSDSD